MIDREKVIKGLEAHGCGKSMWRICNKCPYDKEECIKDRCRDNLLADAYALLKEQDEEIQNLRRENHNILTQFHEWAKEQEAVEPKQGEWIYCEDASGQDGYKCSECGFFEPWYYDFENHNFITDYVYCPSCGKPMQEGR